MYIRAKGIDYNELSYAIKVMSEIGIDISDHRSKSIEEFRGKEFDYVVVVYIILKKLAHQDLVQILKELSIKGG